MTGSTSSALTNGASRDDAVHLQVDDGVPVEAELLGEDLVAVLVEVGRAPCG